MVDGSVVDGSLVGSGVVGDVVLVGSGVGVVVDVALVLDVGDVAVLVGRVGHDLHGGVAFNVFFFKCTQWVIQLFCESD